MKRLFLTLAVLLGLVACQATQVREDASPMFRETLRHAEAGDAVAQTAIGAAYTMGKDVPRDYVEAARWYREAAEQGYADAQYLLGDMYDDGQGVPQVYVEAATWFRKAAEQGHAGAQYLLGDMYHTGQGVSQDLPEAARWYRKSAEQGDGVAQLLLSGLYHFGKGVPKDRVRAQMWMILAVKNSPPEQRERIMAERDKFARDLTAAQLSEAQRLAREWKPKKE